MTWNAWLSALVLLAPLSARADFVMTHSGRLLDGSDQPVTNPALAMTFKIFDQAFPVTSQKLLWQASCTVKVDDGFYALALGADCGTPLASDAFPLKDERHLEVAVEGSVLMPRMRIGTVPAAALAARALEADTLGGLAASAFALTAHGHAVSEITGFDAQAVSAVAASNAFVAAGTLSAGKWCTSDGATVSCTADPPVQNLSGSAISSGTIGGTTAIDTTGAVKAASFTGSGAGLTGLSADQLTLGTLPADRLPAFTGDVTTNRGSAVTTIANGAVTFAKLGADVGAWATNGADVFRTSGSLGLGTSSPTSTLHVAGSFGRAVKQVTSNYTLTAADSVVTANAAGGMIFLTLPSAVGIGGREYTIKKSDGSANAVTIVTTNAQTVDGTSGVALTTPYQFVAVISDGANWSVLASSGGGVSPQSFNFAAQTNVALSATITSNAVTLTGFLGPATATCGTGCTKISRNGAAFVPGPVSGFLPNDTIAIQTTTASTHATETTATVRVGGTTASWSVTTLACASGTATFTYSGTATTFNSPCSTFTAKVWGAGGGSDARKAAPGGGGGYATAKFTEVQGKAFTVVVGGGGPTSVSSCCGSYQGPAGAWGGGGAGGGGWNPGGSGGGRSALVYGGVDVITAGAGGGGGGYFVGDGNTPGGAGGGTTGLAGATGNGSGTGGRGGTQTSGGAGGGSGAAGTTSAGSINAAAAAGATFNAGGSAIGGGGCGSTTGAGGGGAGYFGGGGGGCGSDYSGAGGGGSSYVGGGAFTVLEASTTPGSGATSGGAGLPGYQTGIGNGGSASNNNGKGSDGLIVIMYP